MGKISHLRTGELVGWRREYGGNFRSFIAHVPALEKMGSTIISQAWECDIRDVAGLSASKSDLHDYTDLYEFAQSCCQHLIREISPEALQKNLSHYEIRILRPNSPDHFAKYAWDGRLFLMNHGGSHHFAAAQYIALRLKLAVPLTGTLYQYRIEPDAIRALTSSYEVFAITDDANTAVAFHHAMEKHSATFLAGPIKRAITETSRAIFLPKSERRSMHVAKMLQEAGVPNLGNQLEMVASRQA